MLLVLASLPLLLGYLALRLWLERGGRNEAPQWFVALVLVSAVAWALLPLVRLPVWVRADRQGVAFRDWQRFGSYAWAEIESFDLGNPDDPCLAYLRLRSRGDRPRVVRLPAFRNLEAGHVVERLRERQAQERPAARS